MIEVVYKEEKKKAVGNQEFFHIPRNIRQIGEVEDDYKIYIEDYAYQYLNRLSGEMTGGKIALLLGKYNWGDGANYIFIKSALRMNVMDADANRIIMQTADWDEAGEKIERLFPGQEIVGWYFTMPECDARVTEAIYRIHLHYFGGNDKVLFMQDPVDDEEAFYYYDNGKMHCVSGYYLYYEPNEAMQEYMVSENGKSQETPSEEVDDKAVHDFRQIIFKKREDKKKKEPASSWLVVGIGTIAAMLVLVAGANLLGNYRTLRQTPDMVEDITAQVEDISSQVEDTIGNSVAGGDGGKDTSGEADTTGEEEAADMTNTQGKNVLADEQGTGNGEDTLDGQTTEENADMSNTQRTETGENVRDGANADSDTDTSNTEGTETSGDTSDELGAEGIQGTADTVGTSSADAEAAEETAAGTTAGTSSAARSYQVQAGDTLNRISEVVYGTTNMVDSICQINGITKETTIYPGETILLP